jgi:hypothetical protein
LGGPALEYILIVCFRIERGQNDLYYSMKKAKRGLVIIFNQEDFDEIDGHKVDPRDGTSEDVERLSKTFTRLRFDIDEQKNLSYREIMQYISKGTSVITYFSYMTEKFVVMFVDPCIIV